jgi:hypothetical protein
MRVSAHGAEVVVTASESARLSAYASQTRTIGTLAALLAALAGPCHSNVRAQGNDPRWEVGLVVPILQLQDFDLLGEQFRQLRPTTIGTAPLHRFRESGSGIRVGFRPWPHLGFEAEGTVYSSFWQSLGRADAGYFKPAAARW